MLRVVEVEEAGKINQVLRAFPKTFKTGDEWRELRECIFVGKHVSKNLLHNVGSLYFAKYDSAIVKLLYKDVSIVHVYGERYALIRFCNNKAKTYNAAIVDTVMGQTVFKFYLPKSSNSEHDTISYCSGNGDYFILNQFAKDGSSFKVYNGSGVMCYKSSLCNVRGRFLTDITFNGVASIAILDSDLDETDYLRVIHFYVGRESTICNTIIDEKFDSIYLHQHSPFVKDGKLIFPYYECEVCGSFKKKYFDIFGNELKK